MGRKSLILIPVVVAVGATTLALANVGSVSDPAGDVKHNPPGTDVRYDLINVSYGHAANGDLLVSTRTKGKVYGQGSGATPLLWIDVPGKVSTRQGCQYSDYFVADGEVQQCGEGPKTGKATIRKLSAYTLQFEFKPAAIHSPATFGIAMVEEGSGPGGQGLVFFDRAPNVGFIKHKLR
jgi:hypothetical protein